MSFDCHDVVVMANQEEGESAQFETKKSSYEQGVTDDGTNLQCRLVGNHVFYVLNGYHRLRGTTLAKFHRSQASTSFSSRFMLKTYKFTVLINASRKAPPGFI